MEKRRQSDRGKGFYRVKETGRSHSPCAESLEQNCSGGKLEKMGDGS